MTCKPKILYVDDEPINLRHFKSAFEDDFEVVTAGSGQEALELFQMADNHDIAVVLSDYRMPEMDGGELLARVFQKDPDPTRVILTAYADFEVISQAVNKGHIYQYVQKPWEHRTLKSMLLRAADACALTKENKKLLKELGQGNLELQDANEKLAFELQKNRISEQKRRKAELLMMSQAKLASLGEMATGIAHEINQPLTFIKIMMEATRRDFRGNLSNIEEFSADVDEALEQIRRITTIIDHLRTFGRSDSGQFGPLSLVDVIHNALIPLRHRLRLDNISFNMHMDPGLPAIYGAAVSLEQVFINLINNAVDAMVGNDKAELSSSPAQTKLMPLRYNKKLTIKACLVQKDVQITISDNGCGMDSDILAKIFEPFYTTKEVGSGTGIGLAITYGIVKDHGGSITCRSAPGAGTVFTIILPEITEQLVSG